MAEGIEQKQAKIPEPSQELPHLRTNESLFALKQQIDAHLEHEDDGSKGEKVDSKSVLSAADQLLGQYFIERPGDETHNALVRKLRDNPLLQQQISSFLIGSLTQSLPIFYASQYDIESFGNQDSEAGVDKFELGNLLTALNKGVVDILKLKDFKHFEQIQRDISFWEDPKAKPSQSITEKLIVNIGSLSPEEQRNLLNQRPSDPKFIEGCIFAVGKEVGEGLEELIMLIKDLVSIILNNQVAPFRYTWYRICKGSAVENTSEEHEYSMKIRAMTEAHPFFDLFHSLSSMEGWNGIKNSVGQLFDSDLQAKDVGRIIGIILSLVGGASALKKLLRKPGMLEKTRPGFAFGAAASLTEKTVDGINTAKNES